MKNYRKSLIYITMICIAVTVTSCGLSKVVNLLKCSFDMDGITDITWAGINMSKIKSVSDLSVNDLKSAASAIKNKDFNVGCNIKVNVKNSTSRDAKMIAYDYELLIDNASVATGSSEDNSYIIKPNATTPIKVPISVDLVKIFRNQEGELKSLVKFARNLTDYGNGDPSNVKVKFSPKFTIGKKMQTFPPFILSKTIGNKEN
ncbi:MAG: LEA type 2 family protein [Bacteroidales bacterium]|nr:LEA type 2 family protein [Bacteroidales bacterium]